MNFLKDYHVNWVVDPALFILSPLFFYQAYFRIHNEGLLLKRSQRAAYWGRIQKLCFVISVTVVGFAFIAVHSTAYNPTIIDCLAVFGTILAIVAWRENAISSAEIVSMARSLPTRYIGLFPGHLGDINELLKNSKDEFCIFADCLDYGSFSHPWVHDQFLRMLKFGPNPDRGKKHRPKVRIILAGPPQPISSASRHYPKWREASGDSALWNELYKSVPFQRDLRAFREYQISGEQCVPIDISAMNHSASPPSYSEFAEVLKQYHTKVRMYLEDLSAKNDIAIYDLDESSLNGGHPDFMFWIQDDIEAVFLLPSPNAGSGGLAFRTRDAKLIELFKTAFEEFANKAISLRRTKKSAAQERGPVPEK